MTLDQTIVENQLGHIADHEQIASLLNAAPATYVEAGSQVFDVKDYGAVMDGTTDDSAALTACLAAANAVKGTVFLPPGVLKFFGNMVLGTNAKLRGSGIVSTQLKAGNATACLEIGIGTTRTYTNVEHITLDGNFVSPMMLNINRAFASTFLAIRVINTAIGGEAVRTQGSQNCNFNKLSITDFAGDGLSMYGSTAGDLFLGIRIGQATSATSWHLVLDSEVNGDNPQNHFFLGGHFEGPHDTQTVMLQLGACANVFFNKVQINGENNNKGPLRLVNIDTIAKRIRFTDCTLQGAPLGTPAVPNQNVGVYLNDTLTTPVNTFRSGMFGRMRLQDLDVAFRFGSGGHQWEYTGPLVNGATDNITAVTTGDATKLVNRQLGTLMAESHTAGVNIFEGKNAAGDTMFTIDDTGAVTQAVVPVGGFLTPAVATADVTVTNSVTNVTVLTVAGLVAGAKYLVRAELLYSMGSTTSQAKVGIGAPASSTILWSTGGLPGTVVTGTSGVTERELRTSETARVLGGAAATSLVARPVALVTCTSTGGSVTLRFSQNVAEANNAVALTGSTMTVQRIA